MSRGLGGTQRAIAEVLKANPGKTFNTSDLVASVYPGINRIEKKHRVALLRATNRVCADLWWRGWRAGDQSGVVWFNLLDYRSYATGLIQSGRHGLVHEWIFDQAEVSKRAAETFADAARPFEERLAEHAMGTRRPRPIGAAAIVRDIFYWPYHVEIFAARAAKDEDCAASLLDDFNGLRRLLNWRGWPDIASFATSPTDNPDDFSFFKMDAKVEQA